MDLTKIVGNDAASMVAALTDLLDQAGDLAESRSVKCVGTPDEEHYASAADMLRSAAADLVDQADACFP